jgi:hypothetical protein
MNGCADGDVADRVGSDVSRLPDGAVKKLTGGTDARAWSTGLRGTVAALGVTVALYALVEQWPVRADRAHHHVFGVVMILGGVALLITGRPRWRVGWRGWIWVGLAAAIGSAAGLAASRDGVCCAFTYSVHRGYPFRWLHASLELDGLVSTEQARTLMLGQPNAVMRSADWLVAGVDVLFWAYLGLLLVLATRLLRYVVAVLRGESVRHRP